MWLSRAPGSHLSASSQPFGASSLQAGGLLPGELGEGKGLTQKIPRSKALSATVFHFSSPLLSCLLRSCCLSHSLVPWSPGSDPSHPLVHTSLTTRTSAHPPCLFGQDKATRQGHTRNTTKEPRFSSAGTKGRVACRPICLTVLSSHFTGEAVPRFHLFLSYCTYNSTKPPRHRQAWKVGTKLYTHTYLGREAQERTR